MNFIVCEDNEHMRNKVKQIIDNMMMKNKLNYKTHLFADYNKSFYEIMNEELSNKVYILDIETPSASGIDVAREIRENDIDSIIIFLTSHNELGSELLHDEIMFLTFITKFNNMEKRLESALSKAIKMSGVRQAIRYENKGIIYTIPINDILYITTDQIDRKTLIVTAYNEFRIAKTLQEVSTMLNGNFVQTHRACFVNMNRVRNINKRKNTITFDDDITIDLLSDNFKRGLK